MRIRIKEMDKLLKPDSQIWYVPTTRNVSLLSFVEALVNDCV